MAFDGVANKIDEWLTTYSERLGFEAMGHDEVSIIDCRPHVAERVSPPVRARANARGLAVRNLRETAANLRAGAEAYRRTDEANAGGFGS